MSRRVVVIGAGIVGACTALELTRQAWKVMLIDPAPPGGPQAASYGNGTWISPGSIIPVATPGLWKKLPALLTDPSSPLIVRWRSLPGHLFWLLRLLHAGATTKRVEEIGRSDLIRSQGLLFAYQDRRAFEDEALFWKLRRDRGVVYQELNERAIREREPSLGPGYNYGALVPDGAHCLDPGGLVAAIVGAAVKAGARHVVAEAKGFDFRNGVLGAVRTGDGVIDCDFAVIAAGMHSPALATKVGDKISMKSERGYHAVIRNPKVKPRNPVMPADGKIANIMTLIGLRIAGLGTAPDWGRVGLLIAQALKLLPGLGPRQDMVVDRWLGHRPSTSDGLPIIGRSFASTKVIHAFGHGHVGLASDPKTAGCRPVAGDRYHSLFATAVPPPLQSTQLNRCNEDDSSCPHQ